MEKIKIGKNSLNADNGNIVIPLFLTADAETNLKQELVLKENYTEKVKSTLIPDIVDYEKVVFTPVYIQNVNYHNISELEFNFHFRQRKTDSENAWAVIENKGWNGIENGTELNTNIARKSDLLSYLNFTWDDVYYQANKIKKTFIRLSYYDSNNPLTQQLLGYSTVFLDSGELYGKCTRLEKKGDFTNDTVDKRIDTRITVKDKFNTDKSSEGFYLYFFPDEVLGEESYEKDVYLKVEFNHAGYGRTLLFTRPYPGTTAKPMSLDTDNIYDYIYIKIRLKYLESEKRFVYFIPENDINFSTDVDTDNSKIIFNLFEANIV